MLQAHPCCCRQVAGWDLSDLRGLPCEFSPSEHSAATAPACRRTAHGAQRSEHGLALQGLPDRQMGHVPALCGVLGTCSLGLLSDPGEVAQIEMSVLLTPLWVLQTPVRPYGIPLHAAASDCPTQKTKNLSSPKKEISQRGQSSPVPHGKASLLTPRSNFAP